MCTKENNNNAGSSIIRRKRRVAQQLDSKKSPPGRSRHTKSGGIFFGGYYRKSKTREVPSSEAVSTRVHSGESAKSNMALVWPRRSRTHWDVRASQSRTTPSVDVLRVALSRPPVELDLVPIDDESLRTEGGDAGDSGGGGGVRGRQAFVLNHMEHWFTVRQHTSGSWWNLNSMLPRPEPISEFALDAFLAAMKQDGYSVFVVRGTMPPPAQPYSCGAQDGSEWHRVADLLGGNGGSAAGGARPSSTSTPRAARRARKSGGRPAKKRKQTSGVGRGSTQFTAHDQSSVYTSKATHSNERMCKHCTKLNGLRELPHFSLCFSFDGQQLLDVVITR